ncbi:hypothetical protein IL306_006718 [Fusarium sp. DS 682]|nr:hypothetical protein IL306_006718 [Fusarium sp. DS 682]
MRLLHTADLELVEFFDDSTPEYAILSHTWGDEEVTLQEMKPPGSAGNLKASNSLGQKKGYYKVRNAATVAARDGYKYIWVDTCCIDKTSSAELQEAINSMFRWYKKSARCYVYLVDVPPAEEERPEAVCSQFHRSRWFTRGWTLQELIAPRNLQFRARDWSYLGSKDEDKFIGLVSKITSIERSILRGQKSLAQLSVANRMRWASYRQTTRAEDIAYSMLGIFDVNMPLLYGEGKRAFMRLQEEILKKTSDQSIFSWTSYEPAANDEGSLYGLFAESPMRFRDSIGIQNFPPSPTTPSVPISSTSHGLCVQLYLRPDLEPYYATGTEDYFAILDCFVRIGDREFCPVLYLRRLGYDQYARVRPGYRKLLPPVDYQVPGYIEGYRTIYVREKPVYQIPELRIPAPVDILPADVLDGSRTIYQFEEAFPEERWNPDTLTLRPLFSQNSEIVGIFRFHNGMKREQKIDIAVGLNRILTMKWEAWCFQRRCRGESLKAAFEKINADIKQVCQKGAPRHWFSFQFMLGEDALVLSDARITAVQLQTRSYFSVSVFAKPEICTIRELTQINEPAKSLSIRVNHEHLMACFAVQDPLHAHNPRPAGEVHGVRTRGAQMLSKDWNTSQEIAKLFLVDDDVGRRRGLGHLHSAVAKGDAQLCHSIMDTIPNAASHRIHGWTPLHLAAALGNLDMVHCLLNHPSLESSASSIADQRTLSLLETPLHLLAAYAPFHKQCTGLQLFRAYLPSEESLTYLFSRNDIGETILHRAAAVGADQLIRLFIRLADERNAAYNRNAGFHEVIDTFRSDFIRQIDYVDNYGRTPLWHAAVGGSCSTISLLIDFGAQINLGDDWGITALHAACREGQEGACHCLLKAGASPHLETSTLGLSPVHYAAFFGHSKCLEVLFSFGADANVGSEVKPLHLAVAAGQLRCAQMLVSAGANAALPAKFVLQPDEDGTSIRLVSSAETLFEIAQLRGEQKMLQFVKALKQEAGDKAEPEERSLQPSEPNKAPRGVNSERAIQIQAMFCQATATVSQSRYAPFLVAPHAEGFSPTAQPTAERGMVGNTPGVNATGSSADSLKMHVTTAAPVSTTWHQGRSSTPQAIDPGARDNHRGLRGWTNLLRTRLSSKKA